MRKPGRGQAAVCVAPGDCAVRAMLLVRNGVHHDARVLRAARVAQRTLAGSTLVVGVATDAAPAGADVVEGVAVVRLAAPKRPRPARRSTATETATLGRPVTTASGASHLTWIGRMKRTASGLAFALQAFALARRLRPQVVHANDWNTMGAGLLAKWLCGARLVYDSHELWADRNGRWEWRPWLVACEALFVRAADAVITSSPGYADALAARYRVARPAVVRNIPETSTTQAPAGGLTAPTDAPEHPLVVYVGGLMPGRGLEQMIDTLPLVPDARLRAVGPGAAHYRASLLAQARTVGVLDRVELRDPVAPGDVGEILAGATAGLCLIQPICRSYELSLPNKLFEYAAAGVPVLASDLPVIGGLVHREQIGVLAAARDPHAIAASLRSLAEPGRQRLTAQRASAFAAAHSWPQEARILERVYRGQPNGRPQQPLDALAPAAR